MIIALATPQVAASLDEGMTKVGRLIAKAAAQGAAIICFPEAYLPGLRGLDFAVPMFGPDDRQRVLDVVAESAHRHRIATILGMEWHSDAGRQIAAAVFAADGTLLGCQTKNQLDPTEEPLYVPGLTRQIFEANGIKFGVAICHEAFRYPETVRWAAVRGAQIVFHPHCTGSDRTGTQPTQWGSPDGPYFEKAMMCRALENTIYFASVNYAFRYQESATSIIDPTGKCVAHLPYGEEGVLVQSIDVEAATGLLAKRFAPERYKDVIATK
ncbi:MAG TPA: carbon-nitrogen hydrolase family protein [Gemmataceae bacterium]|jgi:predicted amidohydrolase|nr:carbon-nitrogen hydrolase family protein [Gemmataceae bacterium]